MAPCIHIPDIDLRFPCSVLANLLQGRWGTLGGILPISEKKARQASSDNVLEDRGICILQDSSGQGHTLQRFNPNANRPAASQAFRTNSSSTSDSTCIRYDSLRYSGIAMLQQCDILSRLNKCNAERTADNWWYVVPPRQRCNRRTWTFGQRAADFYRPAAQPDCKSTVMYGS